MVSGDAVGSRHEDGGWSARPEGCTRDRFDAPPAPTRSVAAFVWQRPGIHDPLKESIEKNPDAPLRLELWRGDEGLEATLHTQKKFGVRLNAKVCARFAASTREEAAREGERPTLDGAIAFDCRVPEGHFRADVRFSGCSY